MGLRDTPCGKCPKVRLHFYSTWIPPLSCLATQIGLSENPEPSAFKENGLLAGHAPRRQTRGVTDRVLYRGPGCGAPGQ